MIRPRRFWTFWCAAFLACCIGIGSGLRAQVPMTGAGLGAPGGGVTTACSTLMGQVSGIQVCLDADAGVFLSGSDVTSWTDAANSYVFGTNVVNTITCTSPTFSATGFGGKAGITFAQASTQCLGTTAAAVTGGWSSHSWFIAANVASPQGFARFINFTANGQTNDFGNATSFEAIGRSGFTGNIQCSWNSTLACTDYAGSFGAAHRYSVVVSSNGQTAIQYLDNVSQNTSTTASTWSTGATGQVAIGQGGGGANFDGMIRRIVITNTAVSSTERPIIDTFLQN